MRGPGTSQMVDEHPWGTQSHASAIAAMPAFVGNLFAEDGVAYGHDLMGEPPMQALPVGGQLAFFGRFAAPARLIATALLPSGSAFLALGGPALFVVVLGIGGAPLPLHLGLQPADGPCIGTQLGAQRLEPGLGFPRHNGDAGGSQVQAHRVRARRVLGLVIGCACQHELHDEALPLPVGALCAWTGGLTAHQASVLDRVRQTVADDRVIPIDECGQPVVMPDQVAALLYLGRLEHKTHARVVALILDAAEPTASTLEAYAAGFAHADPVEGAVGAAGKRLGQHGIGGARPATRPAALSPARAHAYSEKP